MDAYLIDDGYQVKIEWNASPDDSGTLMGYYVYRFCDNQEPVRVNATILPGDTTSFVDSSILKPGKIYTYYVVACYNTGFADYLTMNSKNSTVVWGIPQLQEDDMKYTGSMFTGGSLTMIMAMAALGVAATALGMTLASKKKKVSAETEDEE